MRLSLKVARLVSLRLEDYAPRKARPDALQQALFAHHEAWGWPLGRGLLGMAIQVPFLEI